ncbi:MAG: type II toxin-antitoxin system RelE/ParE family toxin [Planctomycetota bacterium]
MRVELLREAVTELHHARLWYEDQRTGLGDEFFHEALDTFARIGEAPEAYPRWPGTDRFEFIVRKAPVRRFPYRIAFEMRTDRVVIVAVAHGKRRPLYWVDRQGRRPA